MTGADGREQRVLVLSDATDEPARLTVENIRAAFDHARIGHEGFDLAGDLPWPDLGRYTAIFTATENLDTLGPGQVAELMRFAEAGGGIAAACRAKPSELDPLFGVVSDSGAHAIRPSSGGGLSFPGQALPAFEGLVLPPEEMIGHAGFDHLPVFDAELLATTFGGKPVAWTKSVGQGRSAYWNSIFLGERRARGLIVQTFEAIQPVAAVPLVNAGVVQIDDFPAPLTGILPDVVQAGFPGVTPEAFYSDVWYPDMLRLARRFGIPFSCFCAFDYTEPEDLAEEGIDRSAYRPPEETFAPLRRSRPAELGLHGHDHRPLQRRNWPGIDEMKAGLRRARGFWSDFGCGPWPTAYVPPNNEYDETGLRALTEVFPEIRVIGGSFFGPWENGGSRECGPEPWSPDLFCLPRVTWGHECTQETLFDSASQLATFGVWTHFLHPDDVLDIPPPGTLARWRRNPQGRPWRNRKGREGLCERIAALVSQVSARFPWLRYRTTTKAADLVRAHLESRWSMSFAGDRVRIEGPEGGHVRLRLNQGRAIAGCSGCDCMHEAARDAYSVCLLRMTAPKAELRLRERRRAGLTGRFRELLPVGRDANI